MLIDRELAAFLAGGNSILIATRNAALEPQVTRASGLRVLAGDRIQVLVPRATGAQTVANLRQNGEIAVCVSYPATFRTFQLKGRALEVKDDSPEDLLLCEQQFRAFADAVAPFGFGRAHARNLWLFDCWSVEVQVSAVYAQTPGPGAGARREASDGG